MPEKTAPASCFIYDLEDNVVAHITAFAKCGIDFDDGCGDCVVCHWDCPYATGWVEYVDTERGQDLIAPLFDFLEDCFSWGLMFT